MGKQYQKGGVPGFDRTEEQLALKRQLETIDQINNVQELLAISGEADRLNSKIHLFQKIAKVLQQSERNFSERKEARKQRE